MVDVTRLQLRAVIQQEPGDFGIRGASLDIFAAIALNDLGLIARCLRADPGCVEARIGRSPFIAPGGHIYSWTLGFDLTPI